MNIYSTFLPFTYLFIFLSLPDFLGEVLGFENLVFTIFEFVHALVETTKHKQLVRHGVADLVYYLLLYMQMTEDQVGGEREGEGVEMGVGEWDAVEMLGGERKTRLIPFIKTHFLIIFQCCCE